MPGGPLRPDVIARRESCGGPDTTAWLPPRLGAQHRPSITITHCSCVTAHFWTQSAKARHDANPAHPRPRGGAANTAYLPIPPAADARVGNCYGAWLDALRVCAEQVLVHTSHTSCSARHHCRHPPQLQRHQLRAKTLPVWRSWVLQAIPARRLCACRRCTHTLRSLHSQATARPARCAWRAFRICTCIAPAHNRACPPSIATNERLR